VNRDDLRKSAQYQLMTSITSGNGTPKTWAHDVADRVLDEQAAMFEVAFLTARGVTPVVPGAVGFTRAHAVAFAEALGIEVPS